MSTDYTAAVITLSDLGSRGEREDTSGPALVQMLREQGYEVVYTTIIPDDQEMICRELHSVRHTAVEVKPGPASSCEAVRRTREIAGTIASERIDSIVAMAFHLSRGQAQDLLAAERVFADGRIPSGASYTPAPGERISVRGYGKFVYLGTKGTTRKGRLGAVVRMFV